MFSEHEKRQIIMEHYLYPYFKTEKISNKSGINSYHHSRSCVDEITLNYAKQQFTYEAKGCAIFISACEIFLETLNQNGIQSLKNLMQAYKKLVLQTEKITNEEKQLLGQLNIYENVKRHFNRIECALMITYVLEKLESPELGLE